MRRTLARALAAVLALTLLSGALAACGRYGPPTPYAPGQGPHHHKADPSGQNDDEDDQG